MTSPADDQTAPRPRGRRRTGDTDARAQIVAAATKEFLDRGYDAASLRAIARKAGVDPALVHHYFSDKAELFAEAVRVPLRPDQIVREALRGPRESIGVNLVTVILTTLEGEKARDRVISLIRTGLGHDFAATMIRQFLVREVLRRIATELSVEDGELRATLAATQIVGMLVVRYGIRAEPLASAPIEEVARRIGPAIQWHLTGYPEPFAPVGPLDIAGAAAE